MDFAGYEKHLEYFVDCILEGFDFEGIDGMPSPELFRAAAMESIEWGLGEGMSFETSMTSDDVWFRMWMFTDRSNSNSLQVLFDEYDVNRFANWLADALTEFYMQNYYR